MNVSIAYAQLDTMHLQEVRIFSTPFERFSTGQKAIKIDVDKAQTLTEVLSDQPAIYFKNYGNGQLSTISFRGTSANHTNVLWHGIPVNYPSLGQTDFTQWPTWLVESVSLHPGGSGSLYGSGAIGGSVSIDSELSKISTNNASARLAIGSFGEIFTGLKSEYLTGKWSGSTKAYRSIIKNDFEYQFQGQSEIQKNAAILDKGIQQEVQFELAPNRYLFLDAMYTLNHREVQPNKASPDNSDELETENLRAVLGYHSEQENNSFTANLAFVRADQVYNNLDQTLTGQWSAVISYWQEIEDGFSFRVGTNTNLFAANVDAYSEDFRDLQVELFSGFEWARWKNYHAALNLRQSFYDQNSPFTPSFGHEIFLLKSQNQQLIVNQQFSVGYRYPTLNDRYWSPGGNPDLNPESSKTLDTGVKWERKGDAWQLGTDINGFFTHSDDWIVWIPTAEGFWSPRNLRSVRILGLESSAFVRGQLFDSEQHLTGGYAYTQSTNQTGSNTGNQLPYVPFHHFNFGWRSSFRYGLSTHIQYDFIGRRYTTLDNTLLQSVPGFGLWDLGIRSQRQIKDLEWSAEFKIRNITDQSYENLINRAMPGRNYQISLTFTYSNNQ
ncbi:MAG: TonB-dependent receptor [Cyclobacteriaceae bacterium]